MWVPGNRHGASGTIDGQNLNECLNPAFIETSGTFAWSAVGNNGFFNDLVQIGIGKCRAPGFNACGDAMRWGWAWGRDAASPGCAGFSNRLPTLTAIMGYDGAAHDYKVYHKTNRWRVYVGVNEKASVSEAEICWTPNVAEWFSETWDPGDALGGTVGNKLRTASTNYANAEDGGFFWTSFPGPFPNEACSQEPGGVYKCRIANATAFDAWTDR
jgi:hypothetical protein